MLILDAYHAHGQCNGHNGGEGWVPAQKDPLSRFNGFDTRKLTI